MIRDAEGIAEAVGRGTMRFVHPKTILQLDLQASHRVRDRLVGHRTAVVNQIRAFLLEQGIPLRPGRTVLRGELRRLLASEEAPVSSCLRRLVGHLSEEWQRLEEEIDRVTREIGTLATADPACQRLMAVPGIGPISASALVAAVGNGSAFSKGRDFAAWLGLVPRQFSTGGKPRLLGVSKRGNAYLRRLMVLGAQSILRSKVLSTDSSRHLGLGVSFLQKSRRLHPPLLQPNKVPPHPTWKSHARGDINCHYICQVSIAATTIRSGQSTVTGSPGKQCG
jgi:transposase